MKKIKQCKYVILLVVVIIAGILFRYQNNTWLKSKTVDPEKVVDAIKYLESENPPRIGKSPTEEEIFNSSHIKQIRIALNGYLDGTNTGLEEDTALEVTSAGMKCGLNSFSKDYYKSKFVILGASDNDYGGVQAYIVFVDKPDTMFWVWVYGVTKSERLRMICEKPPTEEERTDFNVYIDDAIKNAKYAL